MVFMTIVVATNAVVICGQSETTPNPSPTPFRGRSETAIERNRRLDREHDQLQQHLYSNLYGQGAYANSPRFGRKFRSKMVALYRKPSKEETVALEPSEQLRAQYSELVNSKNAGLMVLIPDRGCGTNQQVVKASKECSKYSFPGAGSSYSFRLNSYRIRRLADITFVKNSLIARGVMSGAVFVELGNVPIAEVDLNRPELKYLTAYMPVKNARDALNEAKRFAKGVKKNGFVYGRGVFATKGRTFAMRSIAYRGKFLRSEAGVTYNELNFDKRRDIVVAFRILELAADGSAIIVWKTLRDSKSPKLKATGKRK